MLHLSESDTNCSSTTKYVSKLVKDFLDKPLEKTVIPKAFAYHHIKTLLVEFFNTWIPLRTCALSFFIRCKDFFCPKKLSNAHFPMLIFFKGNQWFFLLVSWRAYFVLNVSIMPAAQHSLSCDSQLELCFSKRHTCACGAIIFWLAKMLTAQDFPSSCTCACGATFMTCAVHFW